jgi:hypothetical protein
MAAVAQAGMSGIGVNFIAAGFMVIILSASFSSAARVVAGQAAAVMATRRSRARTRFVMLLS